MVYEVFCEGTIAGHVKIEAASPEQAEMIAERMTLDKLLQSGWEGSCSWEAIEDHADYLRNKRQAREATQD